MGNDGRRKGNNITMYDIFSNGLSIGACLLTSISGTVNEIVGVVCASAIALVTCFVQLYRLWRDRDKDLKKKKDEKTIASEETETNEG